jgi:hypothetical protein
VFGIVRAIRRSRNPLKHPIMRGLSRFGSPTNTAGQIDAELLSEHPQVDRLHLTLHWLVQASSSSLAATRIDDIVWAYVNQAIEAAARRAPWMLAGYNTELEKAWKSNRAAVLATVDQRRAQVLAQA